jgi:hypothetical protein
LAPRTVYGKYPGGRALWHDSIRQSHDVWLTGSSKRGSRKHGPVILFTWPPRSMFRKELNDGLVVTKGKGVARSITPP